MTLILWKRLKACKLYFTISFCDKLEYFDQRIRDLNLLAGTNLAKNS
jgi:hypothetical protein